MRNKRLASSTKKIAVIGAGWAGCAAAVELAAHGQHVTLFEASRMLGGRARRVDAQSAMLDNGQHILLGAYAVTLRLLKRLDVDIERAFLRIPLQMRYPDGSAGMDFTAARLPAPFHMAAALLRAKGLTRADKLSLARFSSAARWMGWQLYTDCSVAELLARFDQTTRLIQLMWRPLCIAALNTPPERASAQVFLNVLRDSLGARRAASDMLIPRIDLTSLLPERAASFITRHGGTIKTGTAVTKISRNGNLWQLELGTSNDLHEDSNFDAVIVATHARQAIRLLNKWTDTEALQRLQYEPITTVYLQYANTVKLNQPLYALLEDPDSGHWGQFVFDRGALSNDDAGLLAVVISASTEAIQLGHDELASAISAQLSETLRMPELLQPQWVKIISEKQATFSCQPALSRPENSTTQDGLLLAGDYTASQYPATLESAIRSGLSAAHLLI